MLRNRKCFRTSRTIGFAFWTRSQSREVRFDLYQIRYEDFCADVRASLRKILSHVGLSEEQFPYERCPVDLSPTNAKWIDAASPEAIATVEGIQASWLAKLRYTDHEN